ncbi:MAG TPA: glycoside hydrolase family 15 protein [Chloroflexi bacterium]|nr:glycoside hydrolase family 15 protein [Chloroflexota bacterium]
MCWPRFDSQPIFGRLIDPKHGGCFEISVLGSTRTARRYRDRSAILETTWKARGGEATLVEVMAMGRKGSVLVRRLTCEKGNVAGRLVYDPRPGLPGKTSKGSPLVLLTDPELRVRPGRPTEFELARGQALMTVLSDRDDPVSAAQAAQLINDTDQWWRDWSDEIRSGKQYRDVLVRSLINLRLLTYTPTGAPVAAPTTSLPEIIGGGRNWDYRLSWPRDASVGVAAFLAVGKYKEAREFVKWLVSRACTGSDPIRVLYDLDGNEAKRERKLRGVAGYLGSRPVRVGNLAADQHQLDVYGWVVDAVWNLVKVDRKLSIKGRQALGNYADWVASNWHQPDSGLWEVRDTPTHYVHSKLWAWIALDRAARTAKALRMNRRRAGAWERERDLIVDDIRTHGFSKDLGSYVRAYGSSEMDSALLLLPLTGFDDDPRRVGGTVDAIWKELGAGGPLVYRYPPGQDALPGKEGAFLPCSFWLLEALLRLGRVDEGLRLFEQVLNLANELLLLPEEIDPATGTYLGNYPLALSQAGLVHAVLEVQKVLNA